MISNISNMAGISGSLVNIDTVKFKVTHPGKVFNIPKCKLSKLFNEEGVCENERQLGVRIANQHDSHYLNVSSPDSRRSLVIEGSLAGYLYGQNVFTSDDLLGLVIQCLKRVCAYFGWEVTPEQRSAWKVGRGITLERVDLATNFKLSSDDDVLAALDQMYMQMRGHSCGTGGHGSTVYVHPDGGRSWSLSFYGKHSEMKHAARFSKMDARAKIIGMCEGILRAEVRLLPRELKKMIVKPSGEGGSGSLVELANWNKKVVRDAFVGHLKRYKFLTVTSGPVTEKELADLPSRLRPAFIIHKLGGKAAQAYETRTWQRHLASFKKEGIDIDTPNQTDREIKAIDKLLSSSKAVTAPDWLVAAGMAPAVESVAGNVNDSTSQR